MALSDRTNLLVQKYILRQYSESEESSLNKKRTGFRRSEFREETHEKACLTSIYDPNHDLIRAKLRRHIGKAGKFLASQPSNEEDGTWSKASHLTQLVEGYIASDTEM